MAIFSKKTTATTFSILLTLTIAITLISLPPTVKAHDPIVEFTSFPFLVASPNPVGLGQHVNIVMWIDKPLPGATVQNDIRRHDYTLTITKPDSTTEIKQWPIVTDTTSIQFYLYTPSQVGTYTLKFDYAGQTYTWASSSSERIYTNDTFSPASKTITFEVQEEQLPEPISSYPLPTEYWTRPIEGQNTDWWSISSNWLSGAYTYNNVQPDGSAPNSPHIMWTKSVQDGGVVGGSITTEIDGDTYYSGMAYNTRTNNMIIMHERLYYELPYGNLGGGGGWMCVNLRTGEEIWYDATAGTGSFFNMVPETTFGYIYDLHYENQHGTIGNGWLVYQSGSTWTFIESRTGEPVDMSVTNVPSTGAGFGQISGPAEVVGSHGELLRYQFSLQNGWIAQWNSSKVLWNIAGFSPAQGGTMNASTPDRYDWNVTMPTTISSSSTARAAFVDDVLLLSDITNAYGSGFTIFGTIDPYTVTAISLKPNSRGQVLWTKSYSTPDHLTRQWATADSANRIFVMKDVEQMTWTGYSMDTGNKVWGPTPAQPDYDYFNLQSFSAYGNLYSSGYGGYIYAYDMKNGNLLWTYGNGGEGNSNNAGLVTAWGNYPQFIMAIADGKIYSMTYEHSPNSPHYKDMRIRCVDALTGEEIWTMLGAGSAFEGGSKAFAVADGYAVYLNAYDMTLYSVGKGPSKMTLSMTNDVIQSGSSVMIKGTITDISAGSKQAEQAARFPNGVPAVSDASQGSWMEYVYMQKPRPMDTTGVPIVLSVVDSNGNYRDIGTTTSDADGFFAFNWMPDIEGQYTVYASFAGSESYWPSHVVTAFSVDPAAPTPAPTQAPAELTTEMYFVPAVAGILVAIAIGFAITILVLRKRP
ncbi:hypothetical protein E4G67_01935 [Candidatus Bathyarchaeota archaeon]|nr:MAG: hypothetical protein E4G67_01935 [Candidatus Bathyarchaeota archaeon]